LQPVAEMEDPYADEAPRCILCKQNVDLDYKVYVRLSKVLAFFLNGFIYLNEFLNKVFTISHAGVSVASTVSR